MDPGTWGDITNEIGYRINRASLDASGVPGPFVEVGTALVENIGEVDGMGVELDLRAAINDNWDVFFGAAWSETDISDIDFRYLYSFL